MGCNCGAAKQEPAPAPGEPKKVSLEMLRQRRNICRDCEHAGLSTDPRFRASRGLTNLSKCGESGLPVWSETAKAEARCPIGRWERSE